MARGGTLVLRYRQGPLYLYILPYTYILVFILACKANWAVKLFAPLLLSSICFLCRCILQVVRLDDDQLHSSNDYICNDYDYTELSFAPNWQPFDQLFLCLSLLTDNLLTNCFCLVILENSYLPQCLENTHWFGYVYLIFCFLFLRWDGSSITHFLAHECLAHKWPKAWTKPFAFQLWNFA